MKRLLFVCTGNICRSPMAEYLLRHMLEDRGSKGYLIESAGVDAMDGLPSTDKVEKLLLEEGIDCSGHHSQVLTEDLVKNSYLIFTMTARHFKRVCKMTQREKVHCLKEYVQKREREKDKEQRSFDIADPYGGTFEEYRICMEEIRGCLEKLVEMIEEDSL